MTTEMNEQSVNAIIDESFDGLMNAPSGAKLVKPKGLVVGVTLQGTRHYYKFGSVPLNQEQASQVATKDIVLFIGSNSKVFTATMLALAQVEGTSVNGTSVNLNTPVQSLLPEGVTIQDNTYSQILLWHLATHSSAFPAGQCPYGRYTFGAYPFTFEETFLQKFSPNYPPGIYWLYSDQAFGLLGVLLSHGFSNSTQISTSWDETYQQWWNQVVSLIASPLGMSSTQVDYSAVTERIAQGYVLQKDGSFSPKAPPTWDLQSAGLPAGAISSTAEDMLTFLEAQFSSASGNLTQAIRLTQQPCSAPDLLNDLSMGLGWQIGSQNESWSDRYYDKNGGIGGYDSYMAFDPVREVGIVALGNTSGDGVGDILDSFTRKALGKLRRLPAEPSKFPYPPKDITPGCP